MATLFFILLLLFGFYIVMVTLYYFNNKNMRTMYSYFNNISFLSSFILLQITILLLSLGLFVITNNEKMQVILILPLIITLISLISYLKVRRNIKPKHNKKEEKRITKITYNSSYLLPSNVSLKEINCLVFHQINSYSRAELYIYLSSDNEIKNSLDSFIKNIKKETNSLVIIRIFLNGKKVYPE